MCHQGLDRPFPFAPRAFKWDGLASQTSAGQARAGIQDGGRGSSQRL